MDNPQIQCTTDYDKFVLLNFNRMKSKSHTEFMKRVISSDNQLSLHPIIVNSKMEVISGQHRLQAAKELGIPIYYIQADVSYTHILSSNLQRSQSLSDVIRFYAIKDCIPDYIQIMDYLQELELQPKALIGLLFGGTTKNTLEFLKSGKFRFPDNTSIIELLTSSFLKFKTFSKEKRITPQSMFTHSNFTIGFRNLVLFSSYNESVFFNKLEQRWFELKPQISSKEWTKTLISVYNWKNQNPIQVYE